ncbi:MAG: DinB family protein [Actinomycetota bacterium]
MARDETTPVDTPDDKDWTWVLDMTCQECGHDVRTFDREQIGTLIRENARDWQQVLRRDDGELRTRPDPNVWSPLEYAAHVRDVYELYDTRLALMLGTDGAHYPNWDQDDTAVEQNYNAADPATVATDLLGRAEELATRFDGVDGSQWDRTGYRSDGAAFTVESFARYLIHDPIHHLWDVGATYGATHPTTWSRLSAISGQGAGGVAQRHLGLVGGIGPHDTVTEVGGDS